MSRLLDEALPLKAERRAWLEALSPEFQEIAPALRQALLPDEAQSADFRALDTLPKLGPVDQSSAIAASGLQAARAWAGTS